MVNRQEALEHIARLADELCTAVDNEAEDIGGSRPSLEILRDLGPATDELKKIDQVSKGITHSEKCWSWGTKHYECALEEVGKLNREVTLLASSAACDNKRIKELSNTVKLLLEHCEALASFIGEKDPEVSVAELDWKASAELLLNNVRAMAL